MKRFIGCRMLIEADIVKTSRITQLMSEANEMIAIVVSSIKTARSRSNSPQSGIRNPK